MDLRKTLATALLSTIVGTAAFVTTQATAAQPAAAPATVSAAPRDGSSAGQGTLERSSSEHGSLGSSSSRTATAADAAATVDQDRLIHRPGQAVAGTDTGQWASLDDFMSFVVEDAAAVWSWYYQQWGYTGTSQVRYLFPEAGQSVVTACGDSTNDRTMEYCSLDDTIYFSKALATALWDGSYVGYDGWKGAGGDFAVVTMLAHEYGHNVQAELGITSARYGIPKTEQHADCFSGAFAHVAYYQGILDANDVQEGLTTAFVVGDSGFQLADHHGTPQERMAAWRLGYDSAGPAGCDSVLG